MSYERLVYSDFLTLFVIVLFFLLFGKLYTKRVFVRLDVFLTVSQCKGVSCYLFLESETVKILKFIYHIMLFQVFVRNVCVSYTK